MANSVQLNMEWPEEMRALVVSGDLLGAIDWLIVRHMTIPNDLLAAAGAMLTERSKTGHIYTVEPYLGRVRIHAVAPGKTEVIPTPPHKQ